MNTWTLLQTANFIQSFPAPKKNSHFSELHQEKPNIGRKMSSRFTIALQQPFKVERKSAVAAGTPTKTSCLVLHHCPPPEASRIQGFRSHDIIFNHLLNAFLQLELLIVLFIKKFASQNPRQLQEVSSHPFKIPQVLRLSLPRPA